MADLSPDDFLNGGWTALQDQEEQTQAARDRAAMEQYEEAKIIADAFSGAKGKKALDLLRAKTVDQAAFRVDELGLINAIGYGVFREGQDALVRYMFQCIARAEEGPPTAKEAQGGTQKRRRRKAAAGSDG